LQAVGGAVGAILTGLFATSSVAGFNRHGDEISGVLAGNVDQLSVQAAAILSVAGLAIVGTFVSSWLTARVCKFFVDPEDQRPEQKTA
jgi:ammonia channel protein AmtB